MSLFVSSQFHSGISQQSNHGVLAFVISRRKTPEKTKGDHKMLQPCQDNYSTTFASYEGMRRYHEKESLESRWHRCRVNELHIEPLDKASPLYGTPSAFAAGISAESVEDTAENLGLAMRVDGSYYPVRSTAYKSLLDRAKISGSALPKLSRQRLASALNDCLELYSSETLLLIRDEKSRQHTPAILWIIPCCRSMNC